MSILWLSASILLCALATGLMVAFAVVVMPGIRTLGDGEFLSAFKAMDRIIQDNDWRFIAVWAGSVVAVIGTLVQSWGELDGLELWLMSGAVASWLFGVQLPTFVVNVPLNNRLQALDLDGMDRVALSAERATFEIPWVFWNTFRTVWGLASVVLLMAALGIRAV